MQTGFNYSMWLYLIWQHSLDCLSRLPQAHSSMQHSTEAGHGQHTALFTQSSSGLQQPPRTHLPLSEALTQTPPCQGRCQQLSRPQAPMEHSATIQTWSQGNHLTHPALASGAQGGHNWVFLCRYIQDCYTPTENLSPFICSSSFLQGYGIKYQNRSLPEKSLHLHSNASECGLQKYLGFFLMF